MRAACNPRKEKEDEKHCLFSIYYVLTGLPWCLSSNPPANAGDVGSIPGSERSPGEGNGNPLQYFCLENPMDRGDWRAAFHGVTKSHTQLSNLTTATANVLNSADY